MVYELTRKIISMFPIISLGGLDKID